MIGRLGGLVLLVLGAASGWFAMAGPYTVLMNPAFRWVTVAGSLLLLVLGAIQITSRRGGSRSALVVYGAFFAIVVSAQPHEGGVAPLPLAPEDMPSIEREGYAPLELSTLFETLDQEAVLSSSGPVVMRGVVKRLPALDATDEFVLLQPQMACCLADVLALGVRVKAPAGSLPVDGTWVHVFGEIETLSDPVRTPSFRVGAIFFIAVSRAHRLTGDEIVTFQSLLENLYEKVPVARCSRFLQMAEDSALVETLREGGPFTLFVPIDAALGRQPVTARTRLEDLIVPGRYTRSDLYGIESLKTLGGTTLRVQTVNGKLLVGGARILFGDEIARNGVLHLVHPAPSTEPSGG